MILVRICNFGRSGSRGRMASSDKELEAQLTESGNKLVEPPSSVDELLPLLDVSPLIFRLFFSFGFFFVKFLRRSVLSFCR